MEEGVKEPVCGEAETSAEGQGDFLKFCKASLQLRQINPSMYSPLTLAYIGDAVYELYIRTKVVNHGNAQVNKLHKRSAGLVKAGTQAALVRLLKPELSEEELAVFRRGKNAKPGSIAKHATMNDYRTATGFEALVGYLFLEERFVRLTELISMGLEKIGELE